MPQIPIYNPGQRLEPGSPVAAVSSEGSAGNLMGNQVERFGAAVFALGNVLDKEGKKIRSAEEEQYASILANEFKQKAVLAYAKFKDRAPTPDDAADGSTAVVEFQNSLKEIQDQITSGVPESIVRKFQVKTGDDVATYMGTALPEELVKREKNLGLIRQMNLNQKTKAAQEDPWITENSVMEWYESVEADPTIPESGKTAEKIRGAKQMYDGAIDSLIAGVDVPDRSATGYINQLKKYGDAQAMLSTIDSSIYSPEERRQLTKRINDARDEYMKFSYQQYTQSTAMLKAEAEQMSDRLEDKYTKELAEAGADQFKMNEIRSRIRRDSGLLPEKRKMFESLNVFSEEASDRFEMKFLDKFVQNKADGSRYTTKELLTDLSNGYANGELTAQRKIDLTKKIYERADQDKQNPGLTAVINAERDVIKAYYGISPFDVPGQVYSDDVKKNVAEALSKFNAQVYRLYESKSITEDLVKEAATSVLSSKGRLRKSEVPGGNLDAQNDPVKAQQQLKDLAVKIVQTKDPAERKRLMHAAQETKGNLLKSRIEQERQLKPTKKFDKVQGD